MTWNIIGCGETGAYWDGHGASIGVNDCEKFGHTVHNLVLVNYPNKFTYERLQVITKTKAHIYTDDMCERPWKVALPANRLTAHNLIEFRGSIDPNRLYCSGTSPFIAISLANRWLATRIILWGVDFNTHHLYHPGAGKFTKELAKYVEFCKKLRQHGTEVLVGCKENRPKSQLAKYLPCHYSAQ